MADREQPWRYASPSPIGMGAGLTNLEPFPAFDPNFHGYPEEGARTEGLSGLPRRQTNRRRRETVAPRSAADESPEERGRRLTRAVHSRISNQANLGFKPFEMTKWAHPKAVADEMVKRHASKSYQGAWLWH